MTGWRLSRRAVLRGAGVALALPWLECMVRGHAAGSAPKRLVIWNVPNGMPMGAWAPLGDGTDWAPSPMLAALAPWRDQLTLPGNLANTQIPFMERHDASALGLLSGRWTPPWDTPDPTGWTTMDQVAADHLGASTPLRSLELASEAPMPCGEAVTGQIPTCAGYQTVSWRAGAPVPRESIARRAFDRITGRAPITGTPAERARREAAEARLIDRVRGDAARLSARVGAEDRQRLDAYLEGVDELERALIEPAPPADGPCAAAAADVEAGWDLDAPMDIDAHVAVMNRLIRLALQCDRTRVVSYMLGNERSNRPYPALGITASHHVISHHGYVPERVAELETIGAWMVGHFAALLADLAATPDGDGSLLDASAVLFCASMADPNAHERRDLPIVLAGRAGGALTPLGAVRYRAERPVADLHLTLLQRLGVDVDRFGDDGTSTLAGL